MNVQPAAQLLPAVQVMVGAACMGALVTSKQAVDFNKPGGYIISRSGCPPVSSLPSCSDQSAAVPTLSPAAQST